MSYRIAVASSDGLHIDETFGSAGTFTIYEVADGRCQVLEERTAPDEGAGKKECSPEGGCGDGRGCGGNVSAKVSLISDCRCVVCKKIGFHVQKQLERKAVSVFDVSCSVEEALNKIIYYFDRIDKHQSLRAEK